MVTLVRMQGYVHDRFQSCNWSIPPDFLTYEHFLRMVMKLEWTSSPGYPYLLNYPTNADMFQVVDGIPSKDRVRIFYDIVMDKIKNRQADEIRIFIKPEPLKRKKIQQKRFRLISSVSVLDQLIDLMLFDEMNQAMIGHWPDIPAKPGWSPLSYGWSHIPRGWLTSDKTGWDWTVQSWLIELCLWLRIHLCRNINTLWRDLAKWRYHSLFSDARFVLSMGVILKQLFQGVMKSGCVNTISDNSIMQVFLHARVCLELGLPITDTYVMGDDVLQDKGTWTDEQINLYQSHLRKYCRLKVMQRKSEFAGFEFKGTVVEPSYSAKHAFQVLHAAEAVSEDIARSYALLYHRSEHREWWRAVVGHLGPLPPPAVLSMIWDGTK